MAQCLTPSHAPAGRRRRSRARPRTDVEVPAWARDDDGCEVQGLPSGGKADDVAGVKIGMPAAQIQALLKGYRVSIVYANGFYLPEPASPPVGIDTWLLSADRAQDGYGERIEVLLAGPSDNQRAVRIVYTLNYPGPVERLPALDAAVKRAEAKYGPFQGAGGYRYSIAGLDGAPLALNSPGALACSSDLNRLRQALGGELFAGSEWNGDTAEHRAHERANCCVDPSRQHP